MVHKDAGIDYGLGKTNINLETGIRYGVIPIHDLNEWAWEEFEVLYGEPSCPNCGNEVNTSPYGKDYFCDHCYDRNDPRIEDADGSEDREDHEDYCYWSEECYPEEPIANVLDNDNYKAQVDEMGDIFLFESPYYTFAGFCSPCAPGAGHLRSITPNGVKTYCFGHDWFDNEEAPYPVYCVKTGKLIE